MAQGPMTDLLQMLWELQPPGTSLICDQPHLARASHPLDARTGVVALPAAGWLTYISKHPSLTDSAFLEITNGKERNLQVEKPWHRLDPT
jgi:hypothetical protein